MKASGIVFPASNGGRVQRALRRIIGAGLVVASLFGTEAAAQVPSPESLAKAQQLMDTVGSAATVIQMMNELIPVQLAEQRKAQPQIPDVFWDELGKTFQEEVVTATPDMMARMAAIYAARFTVSEMDQLIAFYATDLGKKALREMPGVMREAMSVGQEWGRNIGEKAALRALENIRKREEGLP